MNAIERYRMHTLNDEQRLDYEERVAICTVDGWLSDEAAQNIAWTQVRNHVTSDQVRTNVAPVRTRPTHAPRTNRLLAPNPSATDANVVRHRREDAICDLL